MTDMTPQELTALKVKFYDALVCDPELSAMDLRIAWLLLSRYLNAGSLVAWPSAETLARDLGSSVRGVRDSIQRPTAPGEWFKIEQGGGRRHSKVYSANFERVNSSSPDFPLRKPIEEPFEGDARANRRRRVARCDTKDQPCSARGPRWRQSANSHGLHAEEQNGPTTPERRCQCA